MEGQDTVVRVQLTELEELKEKYATQSQRVVQYESEMQLLQRRIGDLGSRLDDLSSAYDEKAQSERALREQLGAINSELHSRGESISNTLLQVERLTDDRDELQRQLKALTKRHINAQSELKKSESERSKLLEKNEELKALVNNLEGTVRLQTEKHARLTAALNRNESESETWDQERQRLIDSIEERDRKINDQLGALQSLDKERDRLQDLLDAMEEKEQESHNCNASLHKQLIECKQVIEQMERKMQALNADLVGAQRQCAAAEARLNSASTEIAELKRRVGQKSVEVGGAAEDLMLMTRENQALTAEIVELTSERDQLQRKVQVWRCVIFLICALTYIHIYLYCFRVSLFAVVLTFSLNE